jgi:tRNA modification GTPase
MSSTDTIFALATPPGKSGVAIVRLSGRQSLSVLQFLTRLVDVTPRMAHYAAFYVPSTDDVIDRGIAMYFQAPNSFTGEDVAEFHLHGSVAVIKQCLETLGAIHGVRLAEPGEFSRRAFINGKMDLLEAEGLADLINAETPAQKNQAIRQMQGDLSDYFDDLRKRIIYCLAQLEAYLDFPDEDIPESVLEKTADEITALQNTIKQALDDQHRGERVRDGIHIVILGAPNVGKSSLLNALAKREAAIVSARAGTTRDVIEIHMDMAGYPVVIADTAGLRETEDDIEKEGVRRALKRAGEADIRLVLFDGAAWPKIDKAGEGVSSHNTLKIINKIDLCRDKDGLPDDMLAISTKTGQGIDLLIEKLETRIVTFFTSQAAPFITRQRHRNLLKKCAESLEKSLNPGPLELRCEELRQAAVAIGKITGKIEVDDVLDVIFREFCIGK